MASLLCSWLKLTDNDPSVLSGAHAHKQGELDEPYFLRVGLRLFFLGAHIVRLVQVLGIHM